MSKFGLKYVSQLIWTLTHIHLSEFTLTPNFILVGPLQIALVCSGTRLSHAAIAMRYIPRYVFGPTHRSLGGWSYRLAAVRSFVRSSVRYQLSSATNHRISLIFGIKLALNTSSQKKFRPLFRASRPKFGPNLVSD